jgi:hypothetical protein
MTKIIKPLEIIVFLICMFSYAGSIYAQGEEEIVIGQIMEIAAEEHIIMVKDRNYIVMAVFLDDGVSKDPVPTSFNDLKVLDVVMITPGKKSDGFWTAKKVILLTGEKAKAFKNNIEDN